MSKNIAIRPEDFQKTMRKIFEQYPDTAFEVSKQEAKTAARQGASELKRISPKRTGQYARGWSHKALRQNVMGYADIIYNRTRYQLTHLLEKPHKVNGPGKYPKENDYTGMIAEVEEKYGTKFYEGTFEKLWQVWRG